MQADRMSFTELLQFYRNHLRDDLMPFWLRHAIDCECGGIFTGINDDGSLNTTDKFIWSNVRAIYTFSTLYNHKVHDWTFKHYPDSEHGEWKQKLDRQGKKIDRPIALPVKDPFHLPRAVILCIDVLLRLKMKLA